MFNTETLDIRVVATPNSRTTLDTITRRTVQRSGFYAVRYDGRYHRVFGGGNVTPYIAISEAGGRT